MNKATVDSVMELAKSYGNALGCSATDTRELKGVLRAEVERLAAQTEPTYSGWVWKHIKSGGEYELLGNAKAQCDVPLTDMAEVYVYQGADGSMWVRPMAEFNARFKRSRPHGSLIAAKSPVQPPAQAEPAPAPVGEYPALPEPKHRGPSGTGSYFDAYSADQMRAYIDADRAQRPAREVRLLNGGEFEMLAVECFGLSTSAYVKTTLRKFCEVNGLTIKEQS